MLAGAKANGPVGIDFSGKSISKMLLRHGVCDVNAASDGSYEVAALVVVLTGALVVMLALTFPPRVSCTRGRNSK